MAMQGIYNFAAVEVEHLHRGVLAATQDQIVRHLYTFDRAYTRGILCACIYTNIKILYDDMC